MRKGFLLFFVLLAMGSLRAQVTVKGRAVDAISGEFLENVLISTRNQLAQTAKDGTFSLVLPMGEYLLVAKLDGYDSDSVFIQADRNLITDINFKLKI